MATATNRSAVMAAWLAIITLPLQTLPATSQQEPQPWLLPQTRLVLTISSHRIQKNLDFRGLQLTIFGVITQHSLSDRSSQKLLTYDAVATVRGPLEPVSIGIQAPNSNDKQWIEVGEIPAAYTILSNKELAEITSEQDRERFRLEVERLSFPALTANQALAPAMRDTISRSIIRRQRAFRQYIEIPNGITFLTPLLFRAELPISPAASVGNYDVSVLILSKSEIVTNATATFEVVRFGPPQFFFDAANKIGRASCRERV